MTIPIDPIREARPVVLERMTPGIFAGDLAMFPSPDGKYCRLSDAEAAIAAVTKAKDAEIVALKADVRNALVEALSCIRWQSFGECRTPGHDGSPPAPAAAAKAIEVAIAALGGHGQ